MRTLTAAEACQMLEIQPATLYAYVSRGLVRSETIPGSRARAYRAEDIERLQQKQQLRAAPETGALHSLDWGLPVLESGISEIHEGRLYYRGQPLEALLEISTEELVALLWQCPLTVLQPLKELELPELPISGLGHFERLQLGCLWSGLQDIEAFDFSPEVLQRHCWGILSRFFALVSGQAQAPSLLEYFGSLDPARLGLLRSLLLVCADHELNNSTFTARCVASSRATPYAAINAALSAFEGLRHGGNTRQSEALLLYCEQAPGVQAGLRQWRQQDRPIPWAGHKLYPEGDPRWKVLQAILERDFADHPAWKLGQEIMAVLESYSGQSAPNIEFGLSLASRILDWPRADAIVWFALGRVIGWLAHIQEQYSQPLLIRPRSRRMEN